MKNDHRKQALSNYMCGGCLPAPLTMTSGVLNRRYQETKVESMEEEKGSRELVLVRMIDAPPEKVFRAWLHWSRICDGTPNISFHCTACGSPSIQALHP